VVSDRGSHAFKDETTFDERVERGEVEQKIRAEMALADAEREAEQRGRRILALGISAIIIISVLAPMLALILGGSWRLLMWAAGV